MGQLCTRRQYEYQPLPAGANSGRAHARERIIRRFCQPDDDEQQVEVGSYGMITGLLAHMLKKGYISREEHDELVKVVTDVGHRRDSAAPGAQSLVAQDSMAAIMLPAWGFEGQMSENLRKFENPKIRGGNGDDVPISPRLETILHDRYLDCRAHGNVQEDAAVIIYGFNRPINYLSRYQIDSGRFDTWLQALGSKYSSLPVAPYHNWMHAFDVFQLCFLLLTEGGFSKYFNFQDACAILIAAIAHDVGHTGTNNAFQIKTRTKLAFVYNDKSPLENMHASLAFETMLMPGANFLQQLPGEDFVNVRAKIVDSILATDPSHHFEFVEKLNARSQKLEEDPILTLHEVKDDKEVKAANKKDRLLLLQGFVHMADIGNAFRPWSVYKKLVAALEEEFFAQGDRERELGVPITPMMDRTKDSLAGGQGFFLGKLVLPLFELYQPFIAHDLVELFRNTLEENKTKWQELVEKHGKQSAGALLLV